MPTPAISTNNLTRDFASIRAVDSLTFTVDPGTIFGFLGPNGSGKTTTIRLLLGLLSPTAGTASVLGYDSQTESSDVRRSCGALLEHHGLYERLSVIDNLELYGRLWHIPPKWRQLQIKELLGHLELWDRRHDLIATWSRGMKQKLAIARTLLHRPRVVFLDEPTAGLDPIAANALRNDIESLARAHSVTVFLTTHNLDEAERICDITGIISNGRLLDIGPPAELKARASRPTTEITGQGFTPDMVTRIQQLPGVSSVHYQDQKLLIDLPSDTSPAPIVRLLIEAGAEIDTVTRITPTLEQTFLQLVGDNNDQ